MKETQLAMLELAERLETLREDMIELGVDSLTDLEARLRQLHLRIDDLPDEES